MKRNDEWETCSKVLFGFFVVISALIFGAIKFIKEILNSYNK